MYIYIYIHIEYRDIIIIVTHHYYLVMKQHASVPGRAARAFSGACN